MGCGGVTRHAGTGAAPQLPVNVREAVEMRAAKVEPRTHSNKFIPLLSLHDSLS